MEDHRFGGTAAVSSFSFFERIRLCRSKGCMHVVLLHSCGVRQVRWEARRISASIVEEPFSA
jgi:hypothetical protein